MINLAIRPSRRRAVAAHMVMGAILQAVFAVQSLVILPLCVRTIGTETFGFWLATGGILSWLAVVNFGSAGLAMQRCAAAYGRNDLQAVRDWYMHGLVMSAVSAALLLALLLPVAAFAPGWLGATGDVAAVLSAGMVIAGCSAALSPLNDTARGFVCALQRNGLAVGAEVVAAVASLAFTVWALLAGWGIMGLAWGSLTRLSLALLVNAGVAAIYVTRVAPRTCWSRAIIGEYGRTLMPLCASSVVSQVIPQLPLVVLAKGLGPEAGPVASLAYTATTRAISLAEMFTMHAISSTSSAISHLVEDHRAADTSPMRIRSMSAAVYAAIAAGVALYCLGDEGFVSLWVGRDAFMGQPFVFAAAMASFALIQLRWLMNLGTSLGMVTHIAMFQSGEGVLRAIAMVGGMAMLGPIGIPACAAIVMVAASAVIERRLSEHPAFPTGGTGRLGWLLRATVACGVACLTASTVEAGSWMPWVISMAVGAMVVMVALVVGSPDVRHFVTVLWKRRLAVHQPVA